MHVATTREALRALLPRFPERSLVPTMGNLHAGHLALVAAARERGAPVVVSIFVNPLQFGPGEDFERYPRTLDRDLALLERAGCDLVFAPGVDEMYPEPQTFRVLPDPALSTILEGAVRPGHFEGVATVVMKLFALIAPARAVFGKKDYQQLLVIRKMVAQFGLPIEIIPHETVRESDGLALSSRNAYLSPEERSRAPALHAELRRLAAAAAAEESPAAWERAAAEAAGRLGEAGFEVDYLTIRRRADLAPPQPEDRPGIGRLVALGAARLGQTRLIDNLEF
jgi:pantoate--beta-alanine ligase